MLRVFENPPIERSEKVEVPKINDGKDGARIPDSNAKSRYLPSFRAVMIIRIMNP